ncbi:unnamed protein product [Brassica oleracea var. botrytis]
MHAPFGLVMAINTMSHISKAYCNRSIVSVSQLMQDLYS